MGENLTASNGMISYRSLLLLKSGSWFTSISGGDAVRSAAIGGEMTDHRGTPPRKLLLRKRYGLRYAVIAGIAAVGCCGLQLPAAATAASAAPAKAAQTGPVSATPATGTPKLATTSTTQTVRQLVQCGSTMYA